MAEMEWHTEDCDNSTCLGGCHEAILQCSDCGEDHLYELGREEAYVDESCPESDCEGKLEYPGYYLTDVEERAHERRQMGIT